MIDRLDGVGYDFVKTGFLLLGVGPDGMLRCYGRQWDLALACIFFFLVMTNEQSVHDMSLLVMENTDVRL